MNAAGVAALLALAGCSSPSVEVGPTGDAFEARKQLEAALPEGPVRLQIFGDPYGLDPKRQDRLIAAAMGDGVQGVKARFSPDPGLYSADQPRLVVILNPQIEAPSVETCRSPERIRTGPASEDLTILAAFCDGERLMNSARADGDVEGPTDQRLKRMLWQTAGVLFPDNYRNEYGINIIPGLNIGIGGAFGF
ncbi:MAG: hypothetical protein AAGC99_08030 [Pseudomonadota bacterium]